MPAASCCHLLSRRLLPCRLLPTTYYRRLPTTTRYLLLPAACYRLLLLPQTRRASFSFRSVPHSAAVRVHGGIPANKPPTHYVLVHISHLLLRQMRGARHPDAVDADAWEL